MRLKYVNIMRSDLGYGPARFSQPVILTSYRSKLQCQKIGQLNPSLISQIHLWSIRDYRT
jgi:hypothetical protein